MNERMPHLALHFLGSPLIELQGVPVVIVRRKAIALLAYLAVTKRRRPREHLANLFWPDGDAAKRAGSLRSALWELNQSIGDEWLDADRASLGLRAGASLWVDVDRFQQLLAPPRAAGGDRAAARPASDLAQVTEAVALYRGDFLQALNLRDCLEVVQWQSSQAERFRRQMITVLSRIIVDLAEAGEIAPAIPHAERLTRIDPLNEEAHRQLIRLYAQSGRRADALRHYEACAALLHDEIGAAPAEPTRRLHEAIKANRDVTLLVEPEASPFDSPPPSSGVALASGADHQRSTDLPAPMTSFVGRESELAILAQRLDDPSCRIMTLTGLGGAGKTSLALEIARRRAAHYRDGVKLASLAAVSAPGLLAGALADALDLPASGGEPIEQRIAEHLRGKHLLLLLDNLEHLLGAVALLPQLLARAPGVQMLVTSRERLHVHGEWELAVEGFPVAAPGARDDRCRDAIELFTQAASRADPSFALTAENEPIIARVCRLVGGMPLAIELAAAWISQLSPEEIEAHISADLDFLIAPRDAPARQKSLRVMFTHSWSLLTAQEQSVLRRLSIFRGKFTAAAAAEVASASPSVLAALTGKFLLRRDPSRRYELHELIRQYAGEALVDAPEEHDQANDRHADYYGALLHRLRPGLDGAGQGVAIEAIEAELDNIRTALRSALARGRLAPMAQALEGLGLAQEMLGHFHEAEALFGDYVTAARRASPPERLLLGRLLAWQGRFALEIAELPRASALLEESVQLLSARGARAELGFALSAAGKLAFAQGNHTAARWCFRGSLAMARVEHDRRAFAQVLGDLSNVAFHQGNVAKSERLLLKSLAIFRALSDRRSIAASLGRLGFLLGFQGKLAPAEEACREGLRVLRSVGDPLRTAALRLDLGRVLFLRGDLDGARAAYEEGLRAGREINHLEVVAAALHGLGLLSRREKELDRARSLLEESLQIRRQIRARRGVAESLEQLGALALEAGEIDRATSSFHAALAAATEAGATAVVLDTLLGLVELRDPAKRGSPIRDALAAIAEHPTAEPRTRARAGILLGEPGLRELATSPTPLATLIAAVLPTPQEDVHAAEDARRRAGAR
jgi:predicted ATPase/DNA-binding SARP family transcriptional activator